MSIHPTKHALEDHAGRNAYAESINLLGCALPHPLSHNYKGHSGEHVLSTAIRFSIHCRRWLELTSADPKEIPLQNELKFDGDEDRVNVAENLKFAIDRIIHSKRMTIVKVFGEFDASKASTTYSFQRDFFSAKRSTIILKVESDHELRSIPVVGLVDTHASLLKPKDAT